MNFYRNCCRLLVWHLRFVGRKKEYHGYGKLAQFRYFQVSRPVRTDLTNLHISVCIQTLFDLLVRCLIRIIDANNCFRTFKRDFDAWMLPLSINCVSTPLIDQVKRRPKLLHMVWHDIDNAFGSNSPALNCLVCWILVQLLPNIFDSRASTEVQL